MAAAAKLSQNHQVILCALEVLRLMSDRLERSDAVDGNDVDEVLRFFRDMAQRCLDNTEKALLVPAMNYVSDPSGRDRVASTVAAHQEIRQLIRELDNCFRNGCSEEFISMSRRFTSTLGDLIYYEDHFLMPLIGPLITDERNRQLLVEFEKTEQSITEQARQLGSILHRLELKYINPHCI